MPELDSHDLWGKVIDIDEDGNVSVGDVKDNPDIDPEFECEAIVLKAVKECKDWGKIPAHIQAEIERLKAVKRHDWKRTFRVFMNTALTVDKRRSQKRVDRRLTVLVDYLAPGKKKSKRPKVLYVRDTSGSMFDQSVQDDINMELENVAKRAEVYVIDADTKVHGKPYRVRNASDIKASEGGGGTSFKAAFKLALELNVDVIVYATDTYGDFPDVKDIGKLAKATLWLTLGQETVKVPFGQHINIDPAEYADKKKK
jgi:predicted metal-dependent peptidase